MQREPDELNEAVGESAAPSRLRSYTDLVEFAALSEEFDASHRALLMRATLEVLGLRRELGDDTLSLAMVNRHGSFSAICRVLVSHVEPLDSTAVEIASVLFEDRAAGTCTELLASAARLAR